MDLLQTITSKLDSQKLEQLSNIAGGDKAGTGNAVESLLPLLVSGLNRNARSGQADDIRAAVSRDHDGSILDNLSAYLSQGPSQKDDRIVDHVLGAKRRTVEQKVSESSGLSSDGISKLMAALAPMVMGALGKKQQQSGLGLDDLMGMLGSADQSARAQPGANALSGLLDGDGDGDVDASDLTRLGSGLLSGFFK